MANPLAAFQGLKTWQQVAIVAGGGAAVIGIVLYEKKSKASAAAASADAATPPAAAAAAAAGTATTGTAGEIEDPTTGQFYPDDSVDPETGMTYQEEITEFGSVSAADQEGLSDQGELEDEDPEEFEEQIGDTGTGTTGTPVTTNAQWMTEVESGLSEQGYSASDIGQGIAAYFASKPLGTSSDGTSLYTMMNLAVSEYGPPPTGSYALLNGSGSSTLPGTGNVIVPNEVGRTDLDTAESAIRSAGLVPLAAGDSGTGNKGSVTSMSPAAGSSVASGTSVTLTYTVGGSTPTSTAGTVAVPDEIGRTDLDTAKSDLTAAGFKVTTKGSSGTGNKGTVTAQSPSAGTKAAKGSTVTITYTVKK
jgi:PASTA domain